MKTKSKTDTRALVNYHAAQAAYCQMVRKQSWGRSRGFKQMWRERERFHQRAAQLLKES